MSDIDSYQIWTAIITPMQPDASIDYDSFADLLREQAAAGNGITILGSTGEALNLDLAERQEILNFAIGLNLNVPLMVGVGGINLHDQIAWIKYLNSLAVDSYLLVVPLYAKPGIYGQHDWFKTLMNIADKPCILYNVPNRTAKSLEFETVKMLSGHPRFWAIKEASGSEAAFAKYMAAAPNVRMMSGDDPMLPAFAKLGAKGVISVAGNTWPAATHEYALQCVNGTFKDHEIWAKATAALFCASNPIPAKALLHDLGRIKTPELRLPLSSKDMADLSIVREANKLVEDWFSNQTREV